MCTLFNLVAATLVLTGPLDDGAQTAPDGFKIDLVRAMAIERFDIEVAAQQAGQIRSVEYHEGDSVENGALLMQIDDTQPKAQREVTFQEHGIAVEQATNDVNVRYAEAAYRVAESLLKMAQDANKGAVNAVTRAEIQQRWFEARKTELQIEQAKFDRHISAMTATAREAELKVADTILDRHKVKAPFAGQVIEVLRHAGEWVNPGDPVIRLSRMDQLRGKAPIKPSQLAPYEVANCPAVVTVELSHGRTARFDGKVVHIPPKIGRAGEYEVWVDVKNRQENGEWILQDGREVTVYLQLDPNRTARQQIRARQ